MSRLRWLAVALTAASALALAACDGDTAENNEYVDQVNEVSSTLLSSVHSLPASGGSPQQISSALEEVSTQVAFVPGTLDQAESERKQFFGRKTLFFFQRLKQRICRVAIKLAERFQGGMVPVGGQRVGMEL